MLDTMRRAARNLRQAKVRTILTSLAIAVGAFTLTIAMAAGEGTRQYTDKLIGSNINPQTVMIARDKAILNTSFSSTSSTGLQKYDANAMTVAGGSHITMVSQDDISNLQKRNDIEKVVPVYRNLSPTYLVFEGSDQKFSASAESYDSSISYSSSNGSLPKTGTDLEDDGIILPASFADTLINEKIISNSAQLVGKKVTLTFGQSVSTPDTQALAAALASGGQAAVQALLKPETKDMTFVVRALLNKSSTSLTSVSSMMVSSAKAKEIAEYTTKGTSQYRKYYAVMSLAKTGQDPAIVKANLEKAGYSALTAKDIQGLIFTVVNLLQGIVIGFGVLALIASVFGIINTQYISVLERTQQIGLMKALGMRGKNVSQLFQFEAAWIGVLGGVIGAGLAIIAGNLANPWITDQLGIGTGNYLLVFQPLSIIVLIITLALIAMLAGFFPAHKAAKLDPIEALRTE